MRTLVLMFICINLYQWGTAQSIVLERKKIDGNYTIIAYNRMKCPAKLIATADSMKMNFEEYLLGHTKRVLTQIPDSTIENISTMDNVFEFRLILGDTNAVHDDSYRYSLPFPVSTSHELMQGNNGSFSHNTPQSRYAFDFEMPKGSLITAARGGVVVFVEEGYTEGGEDKSYLARGNQIAICQDDGTIGVYAHIKHKGAILKVGDPVFVGEPIAFSGDTGYTTGPHLHFAVMIGNKSIPIHFRGLKEPLVVGKMYTHDGNSQ